MTANPYSPNWHWQRLGYTVERDARGARTIRRQDGSAVEVSRHVGEDSHSAELRAVEREQQSQREFVAELVRWARARHHRHINQRRAIRTGQLELFA